MKKIGVLILALLLSANVAYGKSYGTLVPGSPGDATLGTPYESTCSQTGEGLLCQDSDNDNLTVGNGSGRDTYYSGPHTTDTGPSPDCSGTGVYQDGEGGCDDTTAFVITCTGGDTLGADCGSSYDFTLGFIVQIASGTVTLPAVGTGYHGCFKATSAAAITIDPNASDRIILDGTAGADGEYIVSDGDIDDTICIYADGANGWTTMFNSAGFTAE